MRGGIKESGVRIQESGVRSQNSGARIKKTSSFGTFILTPDS